jgi:hypothetical protein
MNRKIVIIFGAFMVLAAFAEGAPKKTSHSPTATTNGPSPKIKFDKTVYDFGTTSMVQSLTGKFVYENIGDAVLELKKPSTSCGCTVASLTPETLKPGEKGELVFTLTVGNITRGHAEKHITVPSNDPAAPSIELTVKADMTSVYEYEPQQVNIGDLRQHMTTNVSVFVKRTDGKNLRISKAETGSDFIRSRIEPVAGSTNTAARVWIEVTAQGAPRRFADSLRVYGDDQAQLLFPVTVFGRITGPMTVEPEVVFWNIEDTDHWPESAPEEMTTRKVKVEGNDDQTLELKNPTSSLSNLTVSIAPVQNGKIYELVAKLSAPPKESENGTISFDTNLPAQPTMTVPVTINVVKHETP